MGAIHRSQRNPITPCRGLDLKDSVPFALRCRHNSDTFDPPIYF